MVTTGYNQLLPEVSGLLQVPPRSLTKQTFDGVAEGLGGAIGSVHFSLVVPTYNESRNIERIVALLSQQLDAVLPQNYEIIVVDDDSSDGTWRIAQALHLSLSLFACDASSERTGTVDGSDSRLAGVTG